MAYTDSETGRTYPMGPTDFDSQRGLRFFDPGQKQEDMEKWQEYKEQYDKDHPDYEGRETAEETDDYNDGAEPQAQGDEHHDFGGVGFSKPPPVPGGADGNGAGKITVNTEALKKFGQNLDQLVEPMLTAKTNLDRVDIAPGGLPASWRLMEKIQQNSDSLVPSLQKFIANTHGALDAAKTGVDDMCKHYTNTEDLNAATAKDLGPFMYESKGFVDSLGKDTGGEGGETAGDGSSGESSGEGSDEGSGEGDG